MTGTIEVRKAVEMQEGAGVQVRRLMPVSGWLNYDPFVLCDHFTLGPGTGFPEHSHRGFEAITYLFEGAMRHEDNLGNRSTVLAGGAQRFTAGRGISHSEMPGSEGRTEGIQLWINLPQRLKDMEPGYQQVDAGDTPARGATGAEVAVVAGGDSPMQLQTAVLYLDVRLEPGASVTEPVPDGHRGFIYTVSGSIAVAGAMVDTAEACFLDDPGEVAVEAWEESRFLICFGAPHGEPIHQHGPFVD